MGIIVRNFKTSLRFFLFPAAAAAADAAAIAALEAVTAAFAPAIAPAKAEVPPNK